MNLDDLARRLPNAQEVLPLEVTGEGMSYVEEIDPSFVVPELLSTTEGREARVVLLSAPAATGKSAAAGYLAQVSKAPLLDLSTLQVGTGTFAGQVMRVFGVANGALMLSQLDSGSRAVIVDALDEAELRAGEQNFQSFLLDMVRVARNGSADAPTILLIARNETADWVELTFEAEGVDVWRLELDFFQEDSAFEFIDKKLDQWYGRAGHAPRHRESREPFERCRDLLLTEMYALFQTTPENAWENTDVRRFLGYAPVLQAVASYLQTENHHSLANSLAREDTSGPAKSQWSLLLQLIDDLLLREQDKFVTQVWPGIEQALPDASPDLRRVIFTPEEQCARLLARVEVKGASPPLPLALPDEIRSEYETAASTSMANHPFLAGPSSYVSVVFRDYLYAVALLGKSLRAADGEVVRSRIMATDYLATPLLAGFLLALGGGDVLARDAGLLVESLISRLKTDERYFIQLKADEAQDIAGGGVAFWRESDDADLASWSPITFGLLDIGSGVQFPSRLSHASILFSGLVELGGRGSAFSLGPEVGIACNELIVHASDVRVVANPHEDVLLKSSDVVVGSVHALTKVGEGDFLIDWPDAPYPWHPYQTRLIPPDPGGPREWPLEREFTECRRILMRFRRRKGDSLFCFIPFMDNFILAGNDTARAVMDRLLHTSVVTTSGVFYELHLDRLTVSYVDVRNNQRTAEVYEFMHRLMHRG